MGIPLMFYDVEPIPKHEIEAIYIPFEYITTVLTRLYSVRKQLVFISSMQMVKKR